MNPKRLKEVMDAGIRLQVAAGPESIEARAEAIIASLASLNAQGKQISSPMIEVEIDKYLAIASDRLMQEDAINHLGQAASRHITAEALRSRFWNNLQTAIARRLRVVMGKRSARKSS